MIEYEDIKVVYDGPLSRDLKLVEIGGVDITNMVRSISIETPSTNSITFVRLALIGNVKTETYKPVEEEHTHKWYITAQDLTEYHACCSCQCGVRLNGSEAVDILNGKVD